MTVASTQFIETPDRTTHKRTGVSVRDRVYKVLSICLRLRQDVDLQRYRLWY